MQVSTTQQILANAWKPYIKQPNVVLEDATCYESYIRNPSDVKLLWECVDWMYGQMKRTCKHLNILTPSTKYLQQKEKYFVYMRMRKKPWNQTVKRTRSLLYLLNKILELQDKIEDQNRIWIKFPE